LSTFIDKGVSWYEGFLKEYNEHLGSLLREQGSNNEELEKILREKGLARKGKKKGKKSGASASEDWYSFKGLMLSAERQNKAEIYFEAVDKLKNSLERLKETKTLIDELRNIGLGQDLIYSVYFVEGVPEKIFIEPAENGMPKYKLEMFLSTSMESTATMEEAAEDKETSEESNSDEEDKSEKQEDSEPTEEEKKG